MKYLYVIFVVSFVLTTSSSQAGNYETCISGDYPTLCKHHLLTPDQAEKVEIAESSANFRTCISGDYPTLCKHHLLTLEQAAQVKAAELGGNLAVPKQEVEQETPKTDKPSSDLPNCDETKTVWDACFATFTYENGDTYEGMWQDNKQHGKGKFTDSDGFSYIGEFKHGKPYGKFRIISPDGREKEGVWKNGKFQHPEEASPRTSVETIAPESTDKRDLKKEFELSLYGSFLHSEKIPNALFFFNDIQRDETFGFRKALRNHDIDLIVLSSPGGSVWEGLTIAGIIHDKKLNTYIPKKSMNGEGNCASACSFMFFAGANRTAEGKLGVHQFYSGDDAAKEQSSEEGTQFTVSEIIGFLNEFETPPWVFERMFQQSDMYYFKEKELVQLETEISDEMKASYQKSEKFISELSKAFEEVTE